MAVPTGGFSTYHDPGDNASASEVMVPRFDVLERKVGAIITSQQLAVPALAAIGRYHPRQPNLPPECPCVRSVDRRNW